MRKSLSQAIALATLMGAAGTASAVNVNSNGAGQALLYPIYSTEAGNETSINITNTTADFKAVKVRFLESMNSKEVYDFNLYLSPYDQWNATISDFIHPERNDWQSHLSGLVGARITTFDNSCTAPNLSSNLTEKDFKDYEYHNYNGKKDFWGNKIDNQPGDGGEQGIGRTRVGHIEVIEMGIVTDPAIQQMIKHGGDIDNLLNEEGKMQVGAKPGNCVALEARFSDNPQNLGEWYVDPSVGIDTPTGGLYGSATVVNYTNNVAFGYGATAIDNLWLAGQNGHALPGTIDPNFMDIGISTTAEFGDGTSIDFSESVDAVSAVLMKTAIQNDYIVANDLGAQTNWVVTYPTKTFYVNEEYAGGTVIPPFSNLWAGAQGSCDPLAMRYWDSEEYTYQPAQGSYEGVLIPSPKPPVGVPEQVAGPSLCYETNVLKFNDQALLVDADRVGGYAIDIRDEFEAGWAQIDFTDAAHTLEGVDGEVVHGLPVIGLAAIKIQGPNGPMSQTFQHKSTTRIE